MGHYCRLCGRSRPNERFSGRGHRSHVCSDCRKMPLEERQAIEALSEMAGFLYDQSCISRKNVKRLTHLSTSKDKDVSEQATVLLEMARFAPGRRRRLQRIRVSRPDLWRRMIEVGLVYPESRQEEAWAATAAGLPPEHLCDEDDWDEAWDGDWDDDEEELPF